MKLNWNKIHKNVQKLQNRIAKAVKEGKYNKARKLAWLSVNSHYAKIIAVFRVIHNKGAKTAGVDGVVWDKKTDIVQTAKTLRRRGYKPLPLKRIYIRKRSGKLRPLGIPTMYDRAMQALYLLALQPFAETTADLNSYGFRQFRSCRDVFCRDWAVSLSLSQKRRNVDTRSRHQRLFQQYQSCLVAHPYSNG